MGGVGGFRNLKKKKKKKKKPKKKKKKKKKATFLLCGPNPYCVCVFACQQYPSRPREPYIHSAALSSGTGLEKKKKKKKCDLISHRATVTDRHTPQPCVAHAVRRG